MFFLQYGRHAGLHRARGVYANRLRLSLRLGTQIFYVNGAGRILFFLVGLSFGTGSLEAIWYANLVGGVVLRFSITGLIGCFSLGRNLFMPIGMQILPIWPLYFWEGWVTQFWGANFYANKAGSIIFKFSLVYSMLIFV